MESPLDEDMAQSDPAPRHVMTDVAISADIMDSQPLNDLGVSVMDQDTLERNVAAQVIPRRRRP